MNRRATPTALVPVDRREESESAAETVMTKPAPPRATLTQTPSPTAQTNLGRKKSSKTRLWRKMRAKVRKCTHPPLLTLTVDLKLSETIYCFHGKDEKPKENSEEDKKEEKKPKDDSPRPRPLHRTCSLFMRSIAPTISKAEIIAVSLKAAGVCSCRKHGDSLSKLFILTSQLCRRYPGFLRVCLSDPHPERRLLFFYEKFADLSPY